ncbi:2-phospho-L-lactate guanylyltransferase, partial [Streptomyces sp. NPDC049577]
MGPMRREGAGVGWSLVVPLKPLARAKSRLAGGVGPLPRPALALAFAQDTVAAALACAGAGTPLEIASTPVRAVQPL